MKHRLLVSGQSDKTLSCFDFEIHDYEALTRTFDLTPKQL